MEEKMKDPIDDEGKAFDQWLENNGVSHRTIILLKLNKINTLSKLREIREVGLQLLRGEIGQQDFSKLIKGLQENNSSDSDITSVKQCYSPPESFTHSDLPESSTVIPSKSIVVSEYQPNLSEVHRSVSVCGSENGQPTFIAIGDQPRIYLKDTEDRTEAMENIVTTLRRDLSRIYQSEQGRRKRVSTYCNTDTVPLTIRDTADRRQQPQNLSDILLEVSREGSRVLFEGVSGVGKSHLCELIEQHWILHLRDAPVCDDDGSPTCVVKPPHTFALVFHFDAKLVASTGTVLDAVQVLISFEISSGSKTTQLSLLGEWLTHNPEKVLFIIDGFDEAPAKLPKKSFLVELIEGRLMPRSSVIVTTRASQTPAFSLLCQSMHKTFTIIGFSSSSIDAFVDGFFQDDVQKGMRLKEHISSPTYYFLKPLATVPLQLGLLCRIWKHDIEVKHLTRTNLFAKYWEMKIESLPSVIDPSMVGKIERILGEIAWKGITSEPAKYAFLFEKKEVFFKPGTFIEMEFTAKLIESDVFDEFGRNHILKVGKNIFQFSKKSYQEFLAAKYISAAEEKKLPQLLKKCFTPGCISNRKFICVAIFLAGLLRERARVRGTIPELVFMEHLSKSFQELSYVAVDHSGAEKGVYYCADRDKAEPDSTCCMGRQLQLAFKCISEWHSMDNSALRQFLKPLNRALKTEHPIKLSVDFQRSFITVNIFRGLAVCLSVWNDPGAIEYDRSRVTELVLSHFLLKSSLYLKDLGQVIERDTFLKSLKLTLCGMPNSTDFIEFAESVSKNCSITDLTLEAYVDRMQSTAIKAIPDFLWNNKTVENLRLAMSFSEVCCSKSCQQKECELGPSIDSFLERMAEGITSCTRLKSIVLSESFFHGRAVSVILPVLRQHPSVNSIEVIVGDDSSGSGDLDDVVSQELVTLFQSKTNLERFSMSVTKVHHTESVYRTHFGGQFGNAGPSLAARQLADAIIANMSIKYLGLCIRWQNTFELIQLARIIQNVKALEDVAYDIRHITPLFLSKLAESLRFNQTLVSLSLSGQFGSTQRSDHDRESHYDFWKSAVNSSTLTNVTFEGLPFSDFFLEDLCSFFSENTKLLSLVTGHLRITLKGRIEGLNSDAVSNQVKQLSNRLTCSSFPVVVISELKFFKQPYFHALVPVNLRQQWEDQGFEEELEQLVIHHASHTDTTNVDSDGCISVEDNIQ